MLGLDPQSALRALTRNKVGNRQSKKKKKTKQAKQERKKRTAAEEAEAIEHNRASKYYWQHFIALWPRASVAGTGDGDGADWAWTCSKFDSGHRLLIASVNNKQPDDTHSLSLSSPSSPLSFFLSLLTLPPSNPVVRLVLLQNLHPARLMVVLLFPCRTRSRSRTTASGKHRRVFLQRIWIFCSRGNNKIHDIINIDAFVGIAKISVRA